MKPVHYSKTDFEKIEINDIPALFTNDRIDRENLPKGYYAYDIRASEESDFATIETFVRGNHTGTILTEQPIEITHGNYTPIKEYNFLDETVSL